MNNTTIFTEPFWFECTLQNSQISFLNSLYMEYTCDLTASVWRSTTQRILQLQPSKHVKNTNILTSISPFAPKFNSWPLNSSRPNRRTLESLGKSQPPPWITITKNSPFAVSCSTNSCLVLGVLLSKWVFSCRVKVGLLVERSTLLLLFLNCLLRLDYLCTGCSDLPDTVRVYRFLVCLSP